MKNHVILILCSVIALCNPGTLHPYVKPPQVSREVWDRLIPYFLPEDHPLKLELDHIFTKARVTQNLKSLFKAGFKFHKRKFQEQVIVAKHPHLKGFVVKIYTDEQKGIVEWWMWQRRIEGAKLINHLIAKHGYEAFFSVPKKWIYPLPPDPLIDQGSDRKKFILIAEDMNIVNQELNHILWGSDQFITEAKLIAFYTLVSEGGLKDSIHLKNVPFSKDGKIVFIDTEQYDQYPIKYFRLTPFLPSNLRPLWDHLIN